MYPEYTVERVRNTIMPRKRIVFLFHIWNISSDYACVKRAAVASYIPHFRTYTDEKRRLYHDLLFLLKKF